MAEQKPLNIYQKLVEVRKTVTYLQKANQGQQYQYVSSSQVLSAVRAKMDELFLLLMVEVTDKNLLTETVEKQDQYGNIKKTTTYFTELNLLFTWVNAENPAEIIKLPFYSQGVDIAGEKGVGKALTYAEKYFLLKQFNIATDKDDPDHHANQKQPEQSKQEQRQQYDKQKQQEQSASDSKPASEKRINFIKTIAAELAELVPDKGGIDYVYKRLKEVDTRYENLDGLSNGLANAAVNLIQGWKAAARKNQNQKQKQQQTA